MVRHRHKYDIVIIFEDGGAPPQIAAHHGHARMVHVIISFSPALLSLFSSMLRFEVQYYIHDK
jgi:hypothetical protein